MHAKLAIKLKTASVSKRLPMCAITHHLEELAAVLHERETNRNCVQVRKHVAKSNGINQLLLSIEDVGLVDLLLLDLSVVLHSVVESVGEV